MRITGMILAGMLALAVVLAVTGGFASLTADESQDSSTSRGSVPPSDAQSLSPAGETESSDASEAAMAGSEGQNEDQAEKQIHAFPHLRIDRKNRRIEIDAVTVDSTYALEFLLCMAGTKEYESLLATRAKPWQVHAGLLMMGLSPGKPGYFTGTEYVPPRGAGLDIRLEWKDKQGKAHSTPAVDWLAWAGEDGDTKMPDRWIFLGSEVSPKGRYWADEDGGIIAVANLPSAVIDVPMASAQPIEQRLFVPDKKVIPPAETAVTVVITPKKDAEQAPHARAFLDIDRFGQMRIDGEPIRMVNLAQWASRFSRKHSQALVVIRSDGRALCGYAPMARMELKIGGIYEFEQRTMGLRSPLLPRTVEQMSTALAGWKERFAEPHEQVLPPAEEAQATLEHIRREREELKRLDALWLRYEDAVREQLEHHAPEASGDQP